MRIGTAVIIVWPIIGAIAAGQRHYYNSSSTNRAKTSTIAVTIVAGPLNYVGVNPKSRARSPASNARGQEFLSRNTRKGARMLAIAAAIIFAIAFLLNALNAGPAASRAAQFGERDD